jgi:IclR family acetate operon transcriptional repressor
MVQSVDRALDILEALATAGEDISLSQMHELLNLPVGTVHRLLATLVARGYAAQDPQTRQYGPGPRLLEIAGHALSNRRFNLQHVSRPFLQTLTDATGETSNFVVLQGREGVYLDQVTSPRLVHMFTSIGQRAPLYCTGAGKAILSGAPQPFVEEYVRVTRMELWTPKTITSAERLLEELEAGRRQGFVLDDEEREEGVCCVAAPVFDRTGACIGAISVSGPTTRILHGRRASAHRSARRLRGAANSLGSGVLR